MAAPMKAGNDPASVAAALLYLLSGPLVWAGHLFLVYAPQSVLCASRITGITDVDTLLIRAVVGVATVLSAAALVLALRLPRNLARLLRAAAFLEGENSQFMISVMRLLAALSLAGVLWAGAAALFLDPCLQLR